MSTRQRDERERTRRRREARTDRERTPLHDALDWRRWLPVVLGGAVVVAVGLVAAGMGGLLDSTPQSAAVPDYHDPALIAEGGQLFAAHCAECHGAGAVGQQPGAPNGGQRADGTYVAPALNGTAHAWHHPPEMLFRIVKQGSPAADSPMRGWAGRLEDRQIHAILAYLRDLWPAPIRERYERMLAGSEG